MRARGFSFVELLVVTTIILILAAAVQPLAKVTIQRTREAELRRVLREMRTAIDKFKDAADAGMIPTTELQANSDEITRAIAGTEEVIGDIKKATDEGRRYGGRLLSRAQLVSAAWDSSRAAGITNDLPFPLLMALGRAYAQQAEYENLMGSFYNTLLSGTLGDVRANPELMAGLLNEMRGNAGRVAREYERALKTLPAP